MISDVLALWNFLDEQLDTASVFSALFDADGNRKGGSDLVKVKLIRSGPVDGPIWFYQVEPYKDYVFVPMPVNPALYFDYGQLNSSNNPDARFFRFVASPMSRYSSGGEPNVKVDFMVFGYKPDDLMNRKKV